MSDSITSTSWWTAHDLQASYTAFTARLAQELPRMVVSKGAQYADSFNAEMAKFRRDIHRPSPGTFSRGRR